MIVYKVVAGNRSSHVSDEDALEYNIGQTTVPKIADSGIFVFLKLEDAKQFIGDSFTLNLLVCEAPSVRPFPFRAGRFYDTESLQYFWDVANSKPLTENKPYNYSECKTPIGTYLAPSITPISKYELSRISAPASSET